MDLWVASRIFAVLCTPPYHLSDELLLGRLIRGEGAQQAQQLALAAGIGLDFALVKYVEQQDAQVAAGAALASLQQRLRATEEDIGGRGPVLCFGVSRGDYAQLLVRFVVLAFCDSGAMLVGDGEQKTGGRVLLLLSQYRLLYLGRHFDVVYGVCKTWRGGGRS
jgi:hypothetical protein